MRGADLDQMIAVLLSALIPGGRHRQQPRTHPYALPGRQVDIRQDADWVEHIPDIRLLRSGDPRVARQLHDLAPYRPVSPMPSITRDLSVAVSSGDDEETLGDRVRDALGADASRVEEVRVLSATACRQLPASAITRLGARPEQKNLLVRVVLRDLDQTLTNEAANDLRDRIYRALHQGTEYQWTR
jgi:phenylalanyl-tRNA synthetase alpha chain